MHTHACKMQPDTANSGVWIQKKPTEQRKERKCFIDDCKLLFSWGWGQGTLWPWVEMSVALSHGWYILDLGGESFFLFYMLHSCLFTFSQPCDRLTSKQILMNYNPLGEEHGCFLLLFFFLNVFYLFIYDLESQRLCKKKARQEINLPRCHVCKPPVMGELGVHPAPLQAHFAFREWNFPKCQSGGCHSHLKTGPASSSSRPAWAPTHLSEHLGLMEWSPLAWESTWTLAEFPSLGGSCQTCSHVEKGSSLLLALTLGVSSATFSCKGIANISGEIFTFRGSSKSRIPLRQPQ